MDLNYNDEERFQEACGGAPKGGAQTPRWCNMTPREDYYEVLGLHRDASQAEVTKAFRRLALKHHPDKNEGHSEETFKRITEAWGLGGRQHGTTAWQAYEVLHDREKRQHYDEGSGHCR